MKNLTWTYKKFVNSTATNDDCHLAVDECERVWFVRTSFGLRIYDPSGVEIANWNMHLNSSNGIYDILLFPNYILLVTHYQLKKIVHNFVKKEYLINKSNILKEISQKIFNQS